MQKRLIVPLFAGLALAACDSAQEPPANRAATENAAASMADGTNATAAVLAMNDRQRNVVFIRALLDSNLPGDGVTKSERIPDQGGMPYWKAYCKNGSSHIITVTSDGTAKIISHA